VNPLEARNRLAPIEGQKENRERNEKTRMKLLKKTTATLLVAIFILSITATAIPIMSVGALAPVDYETSLLDAADRLTEQQNTGDGYDEGYIGGFRMWISETPPGTYLRTHNIGVTAIGILKAHELQDKTEYETALAMAYKFVVDHEPDWIQDPVDTTRWKESPGGVNSWPDIHFLIDLAEAAESDSSLLAAIQSEVSGTTADDIVALAKARWDDRLNHAGAVYPSEVGTATGMAEWLIYVRTPNWLSLIPWDLEAAVKSAVALHEKYPDDGYFEQAQDIADVIYDCIFVEDPPYLDVNDPEEKCYTLGLAGAIEAFTEAELYPDEASDLKDLLIEYQSDDGYWDASDRSVDPETESVQATAYAVMALLAQGDIDARLAAREGVNWLVDTQDELGGWNPSSLESGDENLECDGEAAWAIYETIIPPTIDEAVEFIEKYVDHQGLANSLISKLENVQDRNYENILNALINQVNAQSDKKIDPIVAEFIIAWAGAWSANPDLAD